MILSKGLKTIVNVSSFNLLAQILSTVGFVLITAFFYELDSLGYLAIVNSYVAIISIFSTGYFDQVFFVEKRVNIIKNVWVISLLLILVVSAISLLALKLCGTRYSIFIFLGIIIQGLIKVSNTYMVAKNGATTISKVKVIGSLAYPFFVYIFYVMFGSDTLTLLSAYLAGSLVVLLATAIALLSFDVEFMVFRTYLQYNRLLLVFKRYVNYTKFSMLGELMRTLAFRGPTIALGYFFTSELAGVYGIAHQIIVLPITIIMGSVSQVFIFELSSKLASKNSPLKYVDSYIKPLVLIASFALVVVHLFSSYIIKLIWDDKMVLLPEMVKAFEPYIASLIIATIFQNIYTLLEEQKYLFFQKSVILFISICCFAWSIYIDNFLAGLRLFSISLFFVGFTYAWLARNLLKISYNSSE